MATPLAAAALATDNSTYALHYFDGRGTGERIRWVFKLGKIPFEDVRYTFETMKEAKATGKFRTSLGKLPLLLVTEGMTTVEIPQSKAIERFVAQKAGLYGRDPLEGAMIDAVCEHFRDLRDAYKKVDDLPNGPDKDPKYAEFFAGAFKEFMTKIEDALGPESTASSQYLVGASLSLADIAATQFLLDYLDGGGWAGEKEAVAGTVDALPRIKSATSATLEAIKPWLDERPKGMF